MFIPNEFRLNFGWSSLGIILFLPCNYMYLDQWKIYFQLIKKFFKQIFEA